MTGGAVSGRDIRILMRSAALLVGPLEAALRRIEPATTLGQFAALEIIVDEEGIRPFSLGHQMGISRQLAWHTCRRLEVLGLATMTPKDGQERAIIAAPTDAGVAHLKAVAVIQKKLAEHMSRTMQAIDVPSTMTVLETLAIGAAGLSQSKSHQAVQFAACPDHP